jgi:hypothetical protein
MSNAFVVGVLFGGFGLLFGALATFVSRRVGKPDGGLGVWVAVAGLGAVEYTSELAQLVPPLVVAAVAAFALGGWVQRRVAPLWGMAAYVPGAVLLGVADVPGLAASTRVTTGVVSWIAAVLVADFEQEHATDGFALWLLPVAALAPALIIAGGAEPGWTFAGAIATLIVNAIPGPRARVGASGAPAIVAAHLWVGSLVSANSGARLAAVVVALGFLLVEPIARFLSRVERRGRARGGKKLDDRTIVVVSTAVFGQAALGFFAVRVAGQWDGAELAMLAMLPALVLAGFTSRAFVPSPRRRRAAAAGTRSATSRARGRQLLRTLTAAPSASDHGSRGSSGGSRGSSGSSRRSRSGSSRRSSRDSTRRSSGRDAR